MDISTRADFLRLMAAGAASIVAPAFSAAADRPPALRIMVATDMHFLAPELTDHGAYFEALIRSSDAKVMDYIDQITETLVATAIAEAPDALVIPGDLTYNGARVSHEGMAAKLARIRAAGIPVAVIPGNHDIDSPIAARFAGDGYELVESVDATEFAELYADFGYADALARDDASLSYVWEPLPGLRFLMIDVNGVTSYGTATQGSLAPRTLDWAAVQLADAAVAGARVIAVSHQSLLQQTFIDYGYVMGDAARLLALYKDAGVRLNLCGHLHLQHYEVDDDGFADVATSALSVSPCQYAMVTIEPGGQEVGAGDDSWLDGQLSVSYRTSPMDAAVAAWADEQGSDDPNLLDFPTYARAFFTGDEDLLAARAAALEEQGVGNARELVDFSADVNYHYFCGRLDQMEYRPDLVDAWNEVDLLTGYYMRYIFQTQQVRDQNVLDLELPALS